LEVDVNTFKRFGSYAGLDLSTTTDITAFVLISEPDDGPGTSNRFCFVLKIRSTNDQKKMGSHIAIGGMGFICHTWKRGRL
jgi:hypothetical protein